MELGNNIKIKVIYPKRNMIAGNMWEKITNISSTKRPVLNMHVEVANTTNLRLEIQ